jgi:hypothetical protein
MWNQTRVKGFRLVAVAVLVTVPSVAYAHALLVSPTPRDTTDTKLKMGPCGGDVVMGPLLKGQPVVQYDAGATVNIAWKETIAHGGCYQLRLNATGNDKNQADFTLLGQYADPAVGTGASDAGVKLPDGVTCANCTLQLLQIMRTDSGACPANAAPMPIAGQQSLYYSCADIRIGDFPDAGDLKDAGVPDFDASSQDEPDGGGPTTTPTDDGGTPSSSGDNGAGTTRKPAVSPSDDGCSVGWGSGSGFAFFVSAGLGAMALLRRRRRS